MGSSKILLQPNDSTWNTRYKIPLNDRYSNSSTKWTLVSLNFNLQNYGIKLIYDQIETSQSDMCFNTIVITLSEY